MRKDAVDASALMLYRLKATEPLLPPLLIAAPPADATDEASPDASGRACKHCCRLIPMCGRSIAVCLPQTCSCGLAANSRPHVSLCDRLGKGCNSVEERVPLSVKQPILALLLQAMDAWLKEYHAKLNEANGLSPDATIKANGFSADSSTETPAEGAGGRA